MASPVPRMRVVVMPVTASRRQRLLLCTLFLLLFLAHGPPDPGLAVGAVSSLLGLGLWLAVRRVVAGEPLVWDGGVADVARGAPSGGSRQPHPARVLWLRLSPEWGRPVTSGSAPMRWRPSTTKITLARAIHLANSLVELPTLAPNE